MDDGIVMESLQWDIIDLANHLRQERLFVSSELQTLEGLNTKVVSVSSRLAQLAWVTAQQRENLNRLVVARPDCTPAICCQRANTLETTVFVDGCKVLGFQECVAYGDFLGTLRASPRLLAGCLAEGDRLVPDMMHGVVHSLLAGLLGSCLLPEDKVLCLRLLRRLTLLQLAPSDNPRRLLRQKSCAFARLYSEFHEGLFSAKLFLTAALHKPIMQLLMEDEMFLDIDPDKATVRFPPEERLKKFGVEGTAEFSARVQEYRRWTNSRLVAVTQRFVSSLRENMHCFPNEVSWLVRQIADLLSKSTKVEPKEVNAICTDLVFSFFICPALVNPEPYGITDAPISYISRFNLIQVAKIVQMLAMSKFEEVDSKVADLYNMFDKGCVTSMLDAILENCGSAEAEDCPAIADSSKLQGLTRSSALFTEAELHNMVDFLNVVATENKPEGENDDERAVRKQLASLMAQLPLSATMNGHAGPARDSPKPAAQHGATRKAANILGKVGKQRAQGATSSPLLSSVGSSDGSHSAEECPGQEEEGSSKVAHNVLILPFSPAKGEYVGMLAEHKVLCIDSQNTRVQVNVPPNHDVDGMGERTESHEKRTRFSLSHDDGSIGNTSDNLEAVSEAASNHSVASSLEMETEDQNDNLSDMVSANVSGRGTPNISGRDTPSSQITEGEESTGVMRGSVGEPRQSLDFPHTTNSKQSRSDIDDKFGKFEIKKLIEGDETVSMVSDTWSTDVLASDSETVEQSERIYPPSITESAVQQLTEATQLLDVSETASEAWSTDVLASDSERLTEVDTDDTGSVARSDDTARSEVEAEVRGEPEGGEVTPPSSAHGIAMSFRPIREDPVNRASLVVPASPTRVDPSGHPSWNVTGRGGGRAEYRRRTSEYVDNNVNNIVHRREYTLGSLTMGQLPILQNGSVCDVRNGSEVLQLVNHREESSQESSSTVDTDMKIEVVVDDDRERRGMADGIPGTVRLSSVSLASTSSSGSSSDPRPKTVTPTPDIPAAPNVLIPNGHIVIPEDEPAPVKSLQASATGAIPKSISFDKTAEKGDKDLLDDDQKHKRSFFRNFKLPFKSRRVKSLRGVDDINARCYESGLIGADGDVVHAPPRLRRGMSEELRISNDTTDDILAKYRRKPSGGGDAMTADAVVPEVPASQIKVKPPSDERLNIDPSNVESSYAFIDANRKLRMVLSTADLQHVPWGQRRMGTSTRDSRPQSQMDTELVSFLQLQLAEAINLQDRSLIAHLHETLRCIRLFDDEGCKKLFQSLKGDYQKRSPYIAYLVRCRKGLLSTIAHLERLTERVKCDRQVCSRFLVALCVTMFLEKREQLLLEFTAEFRQLTLADEKNDLLGSFLRSLALDMDRDPTWQVASESQLEQARTAVERAVMSRVYLHALYPNGDGDVSRDQVLHEHMKKLSAVITPNHKDLRIPKMFHYECPWPSAQAEVAAISAYKTPRDKLQCVFRCATTIMNLLAMASERGVPAADDFVPVLVYVLIKANPPSLLSTVQYVNSFYGSRLEGEQQYWWIQFCSAIEFIKTMDYND
ncbi:GTPase-activating protein and VPS9 domain-containing protein 1 isoform X2 [Bacillus rossius redtenbacheri]|uniref:GTPase-activating protein and VPS9 domain-containing protein 1 isoform X2 n=1 Tax=Bacillus rossius redtenbacheri TaxID=93214 RepID=UPI002FDE3866